MDVDDVIAAHPELTNRELPTQIICMFDDEVVGGLTANLTFIPLKKLAFSFLLVLILSLDKVHLLFK